MKHPSARRLQSYADAALSPDRSALVRRHIERCVACRHWLARLERVSAAVRATTPPPSSVSDGAFWARLAGQLKPAPRVSLPMLNYLPPLVFVGAGVVVNVLLALASLVWTLVRWGAIAPLGPRITAAVRAAVSAWPLGSLLPDWLATGTGQMAAQALLWWDGIPAVTQDTVLFALTTLCLGLALGGLLLLSGGWVAAWSAHRRGERSVYRWITAS